MIKNPCPYCFDMFAVLQTHHHQELLKHQREFFAMRREIKVLKARKALEEAIAQPVQPALPLLAKAKRTFSTGGGKYEMAFRFAGMQDLEAADDEWKAAQQVAQPVQPAAQPTASDILGAVAREAALQVSEGPEQSQTSPVQHAFIDTLVSVLSQLEPTPIKCDTCCWQCNKVYSMASKECPHCSAGNANHHPFPYPATTTDNAGAT